MRVIIIEDEFSAIKNMQAILKEIDEEIKIIACLESVEESIDWIKENEAPDIAFMDIQLSDGISFDIFETIEVKFPVIFTTAFNQYAIQAFKLNSVDYILKPIKKADVAFAINKFKKFGKNYTQTVESNFLEMMRNFKSGNQGNFKSALLIKSHNGFIPIAVKELAYFFIKNGIVNAISHNNEKYLVDEKLDDLQKVISDVDFYRANRQCIVSKNSILKASTYFNGRLSLKLKPHFENEVLVSKAKVKSFKAWLQE